MRTKFDAHGGPLKNLVARSSEVISSLKEKLLELPRINLNTRQLYDLELLMNGAFSPLEGFLSEEDYDSVVENMRLADGTLWPIPLVLDVSKDSGYEVGEEMILCDRVGNPLAILSVSSVYVPDKNKEAWHVYGTLDKTHPGVRYLFDDTKDVYVGGTVQGLSLVERYDFSDLRHTPQELRQWFAKNGWDKVIGFQTRNPIHRAHLEMIKRASEEHGAKVLLHPVVGVTKEGDIDYVARVRCYKKLHENHMSDFSKLSLLPLAMRMAGPREAVWHAIVRRNYGCTHFIVGRDHAGPGTDSEGKPFYGPYDAQDLVGKCASEIGITIIPFKEMVYVVEEQKYIPVDETKKTHTIKKISGTGFREMLLNREAIPEWFSFPEVIDELRRSVEKKRGRGVTIFFTGLSCSGKSTIANLLYTKLLELQDREVTLLDGDIVRQNLSKGLGFSKEDRDINIERIGFVANEITKHGGIAICAAIAPYEEIRQKNRSSISRNGTYVEVFVATPLNVCRVRDAKGLYKKAEKGLIKNFTGVNDPYEAPKEPEVVVDTSNVSATECADQIIDHLRNLGFIHSV